MTFGVVGTGDEAARKGVVRLTVKEKVLLQLDEHACEPDLGEYPIELTQKGLAESIGVRRSHIATSMKGLLDETLVETRKERVEGEQRRQNIYALTPNGSKKSKDIRDKLAALEVDFESEDGIKRVRVNELFGSPRLPLASIVNQLEHGGLVRDGIMLVTQPGRRMIPIYCPTCKRSIEVENIYGSEEVGFDCPGCGRPYKISPVQKVVGVQQQEPAEIRIRTPGASPLAFVVVLMVIVLVVANIYLFEPWLFNSVCVMAFVILIPLLLFFVGFGMRKKQIRVTVKRSRQAAGVIVSTMVLGAFLTVVWNFIVVDIDFERELTILGFFVAGVTLGYLGTWGVSPSSRGEFLFASGALITMVTVAIPFVTDLGGLTMATAPFIGVLGVATLVASTLHVVDRETQVLDLLLAGGALVVIVALAVFLQEEKDTLGYVIFASLMLLGAVLGMLRFVQPRAETDLGAHFTYSIALAAGILFVMLGLFMISGDSPLAGGLEIAIMAPFLYFGGAKVFGSDWMYRVPIVAYLVFVEVLIVSDAFLA